MPSKKVLVSGAIGLIVLAAFLYFGRPVDFEYQILDNTDQCLIDCYTIFRIRFKERVEFSKDYTFRENFTFSRKVPGLKSYGLDILETHWKKINKTTYGNCTGNYTDNVTGNITFYTYRCPIGYTTERKYYTKWAPFSRETFKPTLNRWYYFRLWGKKKPRLRRNNIEVSLLLGTRIVFDPWWNSSWSYKQPINISVSSGSTEQNYSVRLELNSSNVGTNFNWTNECVNSNSSRIRFVNSTENGELDFWVKSCSVSGENMTVWVEVDQNITTSNYTIYMYYGNIQATSKTNGTNTFTIFDSYEYTDSPSNHGWTVHGTGTIETTSDKSLFENRSLHISTVVGQDAYIHRTDVSGCSSAIMWMYDKMDSGTNREELVLVFDDNTNTVQNGLVESHYMNTYTYRFSGTWYDSGISRSVGWHKFETKWNGSYYKVYIDDQYIATSPSGYGSPVRIDIADYWTGGSAEYWVDGVIYRKYHDPEPTYSIGAEESLGDTCTYSGSGNWNVNCSDNCSITSAVDLGGNNITITGTGTFHTTANITNFTKLTIAGTDATHRCIVTCSGGCFRG